MKLTQKQLKQIIREEFKKVTESAEYMLDPYRDYGPGGPTDADLDYIKGHAPDKNEDPNAPDEKPFVLHFLDLFAVYQAQ